jgi:hypothetical protein
VCIRSKVGNKITNVDEWVTYAPPAQGKRHWVDGRSAKELAKAWFRNDNLAIPQELHYLLESNVATSGFKMEFGIL